MNAKKKILYSAVGGCMAIVFASTSLITLADHIEKENNQTIADTLEVQDVLQQRMSNKVLTEGNISITMLDEQLENTDVVTLGNDEEVIEYLGIEEVEVQDDGQIISKVDNSKSKYFPPIGNQGSLSTCTAWSTVYYQMSYSINKQLDRDGKKAENIMSPYWVYSMINNGEDTGTYYSDALKILSEIGAVSIKRVPIESSNDDILYNIKAKRDNWLEARHNRVKEYYTLQIGNGTEDTAITSPQDESLEPIKNALASGEILTATTYASCWKTENIASHANVPENSNYVGEKIITRNDDNSDLAHRVTIVGYNDDIWVDINHDNEIQEGEKGAFKIANSYGELSDNKGFIWMSYDAVNFISSVDTNPNYPLKSPYRKDGLFAIIGFTVDTDIKDNNTFLELEFTTDNAKSIQVNIKAQTKEGNEEYEYAPVPFSNSNLMQNVGNGNLNGTNADGNKGVFCIDLYNMIQGISPDEIDDYNWEISVMDAIEDKSVIKITKAKFYNASTQEYIDTSLEQPIELESTNTIITRGKEITKGDCIEVNSAVYSFLVTDKEKYTFNTDVNYANKRYYNIYVLDKEFTGDLNRISEKYSVTKTTRNGTVSMKIKKGKYVYCVAKNKSAWSGFVYRNKAKLSISID